MTGFEISAVITASVTGVISIGNFVLTMRVKQNVEQVHKTTNSKMDLLLLTTRKAAEAEGHAKGLEQGREETK